MLATLGETKVGRESVSGWQPKFGKTILMHFWEELSSLVVAKGKVLPPSPCVLSSFLVLFWFVWVRRAVQSTAGISTGRAESLHCDITQVISAVMLTDLPKLELGFVVE